MKKINLLLLGAWLLGFSARGQNNQINIVNFTVKNTLPAKIDEWISTPAALLLTAQKIPTPGARDPKPFLLVQIRNSGAVICGNNEATLLPLDPFDVRTFNTADLTGPLSHCPELKEGTYSICVQFFNSERKAISREVCKEFKVEGTHTEYGPPTLITPEDEKKFSPQELTRPVLFRWTTLVPKPKEPVTYRLKVWQLMEGQNGTQAMRSNNPIVSKDVDNLTQATVSGLYTGPCKPPYLCDFIWNVQALNRNGKPMGNNEGTSEPFHFGVITENTSCPANTFPEDGKKFSPEGMKGPVMFRWTTLVPKPKEPVTYRIKVWQLMEGQNGTQAMKNNPVITKEIRNATEVTIDGLYTGPCKPPYLCDFIWNVEAINAAGLSTCSSEPFHFSVTTNNTQCPANVFPEDNKKFNLQEAKSPITFKWTQTAAAGASSTYRLKVWQLMQGQNGTQAMKNNPVITREIKNATEVTIDGLYTGPCKPPYLCDFIWNVEAVNAAGLSTCTSEPFHFEFLAENTRCTENVFPDDKKKFNLQEAKGPVTFKWTQTAAAGASSTYRIKVWQLMAGQNGSQAMKNNPVITREIRNATEVTINELYTGPCKPPYLCDFIWNVEAVNAAGLSTCTSEPFRFEFLTEDNRCPENVFPEDKKVITLAEAKKEIAFKWKPITPRPQEPVTYRMKVWQLMAGQNGSQAMRSNNPLYTVDKNDNGQADALTDGLMIVRYLYTGPCKPPYLCDFVWNVEAISKEGRTICTSEPTTFKISNNDIDIQIDSVYVSCCNNNGMQNVYIKIKNNLTNTVKITQLNIDKVNGVTNVISITGLTPVLPVNIAGNGSQVFTGTIKCIDSARTIRFFVRAEDAADNAITETEVETDTLSCPCDPCRILGVEIKNDKLTTVSSSSNDITLSGTLSGLDPNKVKKITIELVYFNITQTGDSNCAKCAANKEWGNFVPPASHSFNGFGAPVLNGGNFGRLWTWISQSEKVCNEGGTGDGGHDNGKEAACANCGTTDIMPGPGNGVQGGNQKIANAGPVIQPGPGIPKANGFSLPIAVPGGPSLSCCGDKIKICIRYTWWDFCCHACDVIKCYEIERKPAK